jgi:hypothetical protein
VSDNKIKQGTRVRLYVDPDAPPGTVPPPPGVWMALAHSPTGTTWWWLVPHDQEARTWALHHPNELTTGCIERPAHQLDLIHVTRI